MAVFDTDKRSVMLITLGRVLQILLSLIAVKAFTAILAPSEVGTLYLLNAVLGFFGFSLVNPVGQYINRSLHRWQQDGGLLDRLFVYNLYLVALSLLSIPVVFSLHYGMSVGRGMSFPILALFVMIALYCTTWNTTVIPALNLLQHRGSFVTLTVLTLALGLGFSVVFTIAWRPSAIAWLYGQAAAQVITTAAGFVILKNVSGCRFSLSRSFWHSLPVKAGILFSFAAPLSITNIFMWAQNQSYRLIVENSLGLEFLGMLGLGLSIAANISSAVEGVIHQLYLPGFYRDMAAADNEGRTAAFNALVQRTLPLFLSVTVFVSCLAPFLMEILANRAFSGAALFLICGAWIELTRMTTGLLALAAQVEMQTRFTVRAYFVGGLMAVGGVALASTLQFSEILIPVTLLLSGASATVIMYTCMKKLLPIKVGIRTILRALYVSVPLVAAVPFAWLPRSLTLSLLVTGICAAYLFVAQYLLVRSKQ